MLNKAVQEGLPDQNKASGTPVGIGFQDEEEKQYGYLPHLFLELRGRGMSLSAADLETILDWQQRKIPPDFIADVMLQMAEDCEMQGLYFPATMSSISRRVQQVLRSLSEL